MKKLTLDPKQLIFTARQFRIVCHPERHRMINMLSETKEMNVTEIHSRIQMNQPEASHHLNLMLDYGILKKVRRGKESIYTLNTELIQKIIDYSDQLVKRV